MLDARVWFLWVLTTLVAASSARNPLYTVLLTLITSVVGTVCAPSDSHAKGQRAIFSPFRFAVGRDAAGSCRCCGVLTGCVIVELV